MVPPSERCAYICKKEATGPFNRKQLLEFLEKRAREEPDREDAKPYKKETRGGFNFWLGGTVIKYQGWQ